MITVGTTFVRTLIASYYLHAAIQSKESHKYLW